MTRLRSKIMLLMIVIILVLIVFAIVFPVGTCEETNGNTLYVDDDGGVDYTHIQDAIDSASDGDTIYVSSGTYNEKVIVDRQLTLIGIDEPIIDGMTAGYTISIVADCIGIKGFIITNSDSMNYTKGVDIKSNRNTISECTIKNTTRGIYLWMSNNNTIKENVITDNNLSGIDIIRSNNNTILENEIQNSTNEGIHLWMSDNNNVRDNVIMNNNHRAVYLVSSNNNTILDNTINLNNDGIHLQNSDNNTLVVNTVQSNIDDGIFLLMSDNNTLKDNNIINNNQNGIYMLSSNTNAIIGNNIQNNMQCGIHVSVSSNNNVIYHNRLINNTNQAKDECTNIWYNASLEEGNYWSDYTEKYPNATQIKGVWDTSYNIYGGHNRDIFPLVEHYEDNKNEKESGTPGFGLILAVCSVGLIFIWMRKR